MYQPVTDKGDAIKATQLNGFIHTALNVDDSLSRRQQALNSARAWVLVGENEGYIRRAFDRVLPSLSPLITDRSPVVRSASVPLFAALGIALRQDSAKFFRWIFHNILEVTQKEHQMHVLAVLKEYMEMADSPRAYSGFVPVILVNLQTFLESAQLYELLIPAVQVLQSLASTHAPVFKSHFADIVDLLVGWWLDPSIPANVPPALLNCFIAFRDMWVENLAFTRDLMGKFISDMEALIAQAVPQQDQHHQNNQQLQVQTHRLLAFTMCFTGVLKGLGATGAADTEVMALLRRLLNVFKLAVDKYRDANIANQQLGTIKTIAEVLGTKFTPLYPLALEIINVQIHANTINLTTKHLKDLLSIHNVLLQMQGVELSIFVIDKAFALIFPFRSHPNPDVRLVVTTTSIYLLSHPRDNIRDKALTLLADDISKVSFAIGSLEKIQTGDHKTDLHIDDHTNSSRYLLSLDEKATNFHTPGHSLSHLSHRILLQLLSFDFLSLTSSRVSKQDGSLLRVLKILTSHSSHTFSHPLVLLAVVKGVHTLWEKTDLRSLPDIFSTVSPTLLKALESSIPQIVICVVELLLSVVQSSTTEPHPFAPIFSQVLVRALVSASTMVDETVRVKVGQLLLDTILSHVLSRFSFDDVLYASIVRLADQAEQVRATYNSIISVLGPLVRSIPMDALEKADLASTSVVSGRNFRYKVMTFNPHQGPQQTFTGLKPQQFTMIIQFISGKQRDLSYGWLTGLFESASGFKSEDYNITDDDAGYWAMWECARFCVHTRLRTPLGDPVRTFESFERMLVLSSAMVSNQAIPVTALAMNSPSASSPSALMHHQYPLKLLLLFAESLEKQIFNAYEGTLELSAPSKPSAAFFRANRKVCDDWFSRIRQVLLRTAVLSGSASDIVRHASARIQDIRATLLRGKDVNIQNLRADLEYCIVHLACALCSLGDSDSLEGLYVWLNKAVDPLLVMVAAAVPARGWLKGMIYQSQSMFESAAVIYSASLGTHNLDKENSGTIQNMDPVTVECVIQQLTSCYVKIGDWNSLETWMEQLRSLRLRNQPLAAALTLPYDSNALLAWAEWDRGDTSMACTHFARTSRVPVIAPFANHERLYVSHMLLLGTILAKTDASVAMFPSDGDMATNLNVQLIVARSLLEEPLRVIALDSLHTLPSSSAATPTTPSSPLLRPYYSLLHVLHVVQNMQEKNANWPAPYFPSYSKLDPALHSVGDWVHVWRVWSHLQSQFPNSQVALSNENMHRQICKLARKQSNFILAERLLTRNDEESLPILANESSNLVTIQEYGQWKEFERLKLLHSQISDAGGDIVPVLNKLLDLSHRSSGTQAAKIKLKLASWIHSPSSPSSLPSLPTVQQLFCESTQESPQYAEAWLRYGDWAYRVGHKDTFRGSESASAMLEADEQQELAEILSVQGNDDASFSELVGLVGSCIFRFVDHAPEDNQDVVAKDPFEESIVAIKARCPDISDERIKAYTALWERIQLRVLSHYDVAAHCYYEFLKLDVPDTESTSSTHIAATLRLLRLLVKYGHLPSQPVFTSMGSSTSTTIGATLAQGFSATPPGVWIPVIPQLFARLGHPEPVVRNQLVDLISKIGILSPQRIVYPAVVGCDEGNIQQQEVTPFQNVQREAFSQILLSLTSHSADLVQQVQGLVSELEKIAVLWDEDWASLLSQMSPDVAARFRTLKDEASRLKGGSSITAALTQQDKTKLLVGKCAAIMQPVLVKLEKLFRTTVGKPGGPNTPHERAFANTYGPSLRRGLSILRALSRPGAHTHAIFAVSNVSFSPEGILRTVEQLWAPFRDVLRDILKHRPPEIQLHDISPLLAKTASSAIPMPGLRDLQLYDQANTGKSANQITISSFDPVVTVLPTKTKPKKMWLVGSNGQRYAYLLKGREDMHLDERIMQFLSVVNTVLMGTSHLLRARHYAVIPLADRAGLLKWADGAVPLFSLYKSWYKRNSPIGEVRPSDMYFNKMAPALKAAGITNGLGSRREWPMHVKQAVFQELLAETPKWLIAKELWSSAISTAEWWARTQTHARSVAVMSIVGYIIGLGDRHLDNILLDNRTGEIVHIDYNICFEKGLKLRIPEKVPFRMTQNMEAALGITGLDGAFKLSAEVVLGKLRAAKETLLTLLEAFVYDPLVDWTADRADDETRRNMELMVMLSLGRTRLEESKGALRSWRDNLLQALLPFMPSPSSPSPSVHTLLDRCIQLQAAILQRDQTLDMVANAAQTVERINMEIAGATKAQSVKLAELSALASQNQIASSAIDARLRECESSHEANVTTMNTVLGSLIPSMLGEVRLQIPVYPLDGNDGAQIANLVNDIRKTIPSIFADLQVYREIIMHFPEDYVRQTTSYEWITWLSKLRPAPLPDKSIPDLSHEVDEITKNFSPEVQAEKWNAKEKAAEDLAHGIEIKQRELEEIFETKKKRDELASPPPPFSFSGSQEDLQKACAVVLRDHFTNTFEETTVLIDQIASIAEMLTTPDLEIARNSRAIMALLDDFATSQFGANLTNWAQQSYIQHKQYSYLVPLFAELQSRVLEYNGKFAAIKAKRTSLEYFHKNQAKIIECAKQRTIISGNDSLGWEEAHELQVSREKAEERVKQLEELGKRHEKLLAQAIQEESALDNGLQAVQQDVIAILADAWEEDRSILASIDDTFTKIEPIFAQIAEKLGAHPQTIVDSVLVLANEDALDVYTRLSSGTPLPVPTSPDWLWGPFQDPAMVVMTEKLDFVVRLLSCLTARPPNLPFEALSAELVGVVMSRFVAALRPAVLVPVYRFLKTYAAPAQADAVAVSSVNEHLELVKKARQHTMGNLQLVNDIYLRESQLYNMRKMLIYLEWTLDKQHYPLLVPQVQLQAAHHKQKSQKNQKSAQAQPTPRPDTPPPPQPTIIPKPECKKILLQLVADLKLLEGLQSRTEGVLKLCTSLESRLPARLHWTLRAWRSATTAHAEKLTSVVSLIRSVLLFEDSRGNSDISSANLATVVKFHEAKTLFRVANESATKDQAYLGYLSTQAEYAAKQAVELQESVADLESAVQITNSQFMLAQQELGAPLADLETALSSDLAKIMPEIQDILQNIVKITDQIESVAHIHTIAESLQETAVKLTEGLTTLISQLRQLHTWKAPQNPPPKFALLELLQALPDNIRGFYSRLHSLSSAVSIVSANYHRREESEGEGEEGEEDELDEERDSEEEGEIKDSQSQEEEREAEERSGEEKPPKQEDDGEYDEGDAELDSAESSVEGHAQVPPALAPERKTTQPLMHVRNIHGINILMRVKQKLDGRDPDPSKKASVQEQVAWVMQEATSLDNLVQLYEGWTPWV